MSIVCIGENLRVEKQAKPPGRKTDIYTVRAADDAGTVLGQIRWYGSWRCYVFCPEANTVFEQDCLRDIAGFLEKLKEGRKKKKEES